MNKSHGSQADQKGRHDKHRHISIRINVFFFATFILFTVLILRLAYLQFVRGPKLAIAVVVPEGGFGRYGSAPIARKIFDAYDQYFGLDGTPKGMTQVTTQTVGQ